MKEARERVRSAILNAGLSFPHNKRITVNLAPADIPKESGCFDLPIALGILAADGQIDAQALQGHEFAGELSLGGALRAVRGALAMGLAVRRGATQGAGTRLVLPPGSAEEAALVPDAEVYRARHLLDVVHRFAPAGTTTDPPDADGWGRVQPAPQAAAKPGPTWPISKARRPAVAPSKWPPWEDTACCSQARRAQASPCWRSGWPACCHH